jgi:hypothetical protein
VRLGDHAEHPIPDCEAVDVGADGVDFAGEILAKDDREAVLHHPFQVTRGDGGVEAVDRRCPHPHPDLAGTRFGPLDVQQFRVCAEIGDH